MLADYAIQTVRDEDHLALAAACQPGVGLCTIVGIDGSFSRRLGAQLAVLPDGTTVGDLADGCLESQLASDMTQCTQPSVVRYGRGSSRIDFRLPWWGTRYPARTETGSRGLSIRPRSAASASPGPAGA
ncbi:MAG: XdhC family protein [Pseudomonadota bacterium]|nr:XdhC family protein [Pseudomonadota bacterium]